MAPAVNAGITRNIQWSMWANELALCSAVVVFLGGIVGIIGGAVVEFQYWIPFGVYGIVFGTVVCLFEYPRGKKPKGNTVPRRICAPAGVIVPTFFGAFGLFIASIVYLVAAVKKEEWNPIGIKLPGRAPSRRNTTMVPPSKPPPRLPQQV